MQIWKEKVPVCQTFRLPNSESYVIYSFDAIVPVGIYGGDCEVDFAQIYEEIRILYDTM
ncbi:MAG: hypothetical protein LIP12_17875 [Clostridiales bacterium]|nr:hypothetical protein [Clostridiales bacterium]